MSRLVRELSRENPGTVNNSDKIVDLLVSIPNITAGTFTTWALQHLAGLGTTLSAPGGATIGVLGTIASVYATRRFRSQPERHTTARVVEYCLTSRYG
jgi:hypothetical protein